MALRNLAQPLLRCGLRIAAEPSILCSESRVATAGWMAVWRSYATVEEGLKYAKSHEWAKLDGDTITVGISDFAQSEMGDVVYVELPEVGTQLSKDDSFGVVESVKSASDVYAPASGEVLEVNSSLVEDPSLINSSAFGDGWMMKIKASDPSELDSLMDAASYEKTTEEAH